MSAASSALLDSQLRSKKRRYSALELLTISPPNPEDSKRPRILEIDGDRLAAAAASPASPKPMVEQSAMDERWSSSASLSDAGPVSKHIPPHFSRRIDWAPVGSQSVRRGDDIDENADYTSSSGLSDDEDDGNDDDDDDSSSSSSSSSSSGSSSENDHDAQLLVPDPVFLPRGSPPPWRKAMTPPPSSHSAPSDLHARLRTFLPTLCAANAELDAERAAKGGLAHRAMEVDDAVIQVTPPSDGDSDVRTADYGTPLIEMDLGLGVFEERHPGDGSDGDEDDDSTSDSSDSSASSVPGDRSMARERDFVGRLMGRRRARPGIEVLGDAS